MIEDEWRLDSFKRLVNEADSVRVLGRYTVGGPIGPFTRHGMIRRSTPYGLKDVEKFSPIQGIAAGQGQWPACSCT